MPLARIDIGKSAPAERIKAVGEAIYNAMTAVAGVPPNDRFQIITRHDPDEMIYPREGYMGIDYTADLIMIQITWNAGRATEVKRKFYEQVAEEIHARTGVRKQDIWINLVECAREDWSFGNGEMQYVPKP